MSADHDTAAVLTEAEPGETYYRAYGWSGCAGSTWATLTPATRDGWRHAEALAARLAAQPPQDAAQAWDQGWKSAMGWSRTSGQIEDMPPNPYRAALAEPTQAQP